MTIGRIVHADNARRLKYAGENMRVLAEPDEGFDGFSAAELVVPAGFAGPIPHVHTGFDEALFILEGRLTLTYGHDEPRLAETGALCLAPRGLRHTFANPDMTPTRVLGIWSPGRVGLDFMTAIGGALPPQGRPDPELMRELYEAHYSHLEP